LLLFGKYIVWFAWFFRGQEFRELPDDGRSNGSQDIGYDEGQRLHQVSSFRLIFHSVKGVLDLRELGKHVLASDEDLFCYWTIHTAAPLCGLTFELSRAQQTGAWPARLMMHCTAAPAKCSAVGARLE
jgi:hypothetical protein